MIMILPMMSRSEKDGAIPMWAIERITLKLLDATCRVYLYMQGHFYQ